MFVVLVGDVNGVCVERLGGQPIDEVGKVVDFSKLWHLLVVLFVVLSSQFDGINPTQSTNHHDDVNN